MKPPASNTGVRTPTLNNSNGSTGASFDWYELTLDGFDDGREVVKLCVALGARAVQARGQNGYASAQSIERDEEQLAVVYGSSARAGELHIVVSGSSCVELVPVLRRLWPKHRVSRVDVAFDFFASFDELDVLAMSVVPDHVYNQLIVNSDGGATRYFGATSSDVRVRVYKKSEQLVALAPHLAASVVPGVVRAEVQVRPTKREVKALVASISAQDVWGMSRWSSALALAVLGFGAERTVTNSQRSSDWVRVRHYLREQYGPALARRVADVGADVARRELLELFSLDDI